LTLETAAAMTRGGLPQVAELYHVTFVRNNHPPGRLMCSYFIHFADTKAEEQAARARQIRYHKECVIAAFPGDPKTAPPSYRYFIAMVEQRRNVRPEELTENSVLQAGPDHRDLERGRGRRVRRGYPLFQCRPEAARPGKDEMARFMAEVATALG